MIFWTFVDEVIEDFVRENKSFQKIAEKYDCYFICTTESDADLVRKYYKKSHFLFEENDLQKKGIKFFDNLPEANWMVKLDMDALVMNLKWLRKEIQATETCRGIVKEDLRQTYIRGGCNVVVGDVARRITLKADYGVPGGKMNFDYILGKALEGIEMENRKLFEIGKEYQGKAPVWHPPKLGLKRRLEIFKSQLELCKL